MRRRGLSSVNVGSVTLLLDQVHLWFEARVVRGRFSTIVSKTQSRVPLRCVCLSMFRMDSGVRYPSNNKYIGHSLLLPLSRCCDDVNT